MTTGVIRLFLDTRRLVIGVCMCLVLINSGIALAVDSTASGTVRLNADSAAPWLDVLFPKDITYHWRSVSIQIDSDWVLPPVIKIEEKRYIRPPISIRQRGVDDIGRRLCILGWDEIDLESFIDDHGWPEAECVLANYVAVVALGQSDTEVVLMQQVKPASRSRINSTRQDLWGGGISDVDLVVIGDSSSSFVRVAYEWVSNGVSGGSHGGTTEFLLLDFERRRLLSMQSLPTEFGHWNRHYPNVESRFVCDVLDSDSDGANEISYRRFTDLVWKGLRSSYSDPGVIIIEKLPNLLYRDRIISERGEVHSIQNKIPEWVIPLPSRGFADMLDSESVAALSEIEVDVASRYSFGTVNRSEDSTSEEPAARVFCRSSEDSLYIFVTADRSLSHRVCINAAPDSDSSESIYLEFKAAGQDSVQLSTWSTESRSKGTKRTLANYSWPFPLNEYGPPEFLVVLPLTDIGLDNRHDSTAV